MIDGDESSNALSTLLPVTLEPGKNGGPTKRASRMDGNNLLELKKDSMKFALSPEGGAATESFRIPEEEDEDRKSGEAIPPLRTVTEDVKLFQETDTNLLKI